MPTSMPTSAPIAPAAVAALHDARTGVVRALTPHTVPAHFPPSFALTTARLADTARFSAWAADPAGAGYAFADPDAVLAAAVGEAVERYCGNLVRPGLVRASWDELAAAGHDAVPPSSLALFSPDQHAQPDFPAVPMTADLVLEWAEGRDAVTGGSVLVPAALVWPSYVTGRRWPLTNPVIQAGLAAGPTPEAALDNALREVVERDAMTMSWHGGTGVQEVSVPVWLRQFSRGPRDALATRYLTLHQEFGVPVVAALVEDRTVGRLSLGVGVHPDPVDAALKGFAEALQLQLVLADYDDPDGAFAAAARHPGSPLKPWRPDRAYGTTYRADRADVRDYACHLQLHLDPAVRRRFLAELAELTSGAPVPLDDLSDVDDVPLVERLTAAGHRVVQVDVTTPDVRAIGLTVVRAVVPGLYSNAPIGLPFLGGERLPRARERAVGPLPTTPLPH